MENYQNSQRFKSSFFNVKNSKNDFSYKNNNAIFNSFLYKNNNNNLNNDFGINYCYQYHSIFDNNINLNNQFCSNNNYNELKKQNKRINISKDKKGDNICFNQIVEKKSFDNFNNTIYSNKINNNMKYNNANKINFNEYNIKYNDNKFSYINIFKNNNDLSEDKEKKIFQDNKIMKDLQYVQTKNIKNIPINRENKINIRRENNKNKIEEEENLSDLAEDLFEYIQFYKKNSQKEIQKQNNLNDEEDSKEIKNDINEIICQNDIVKKKDIGIETQYDLLKFEPLVNNKDYINENKQIEDEKNVKIKKEKKRVKFDLNNNHYFNYLENDLLKCCQYKVGDGPLQWFEERKEEDIYSKKNFIERKSIIKYFDKNEFKINNNYILCENLTEQEIIPEYYLEEENDNPNEEDNISIISISSGSGKSLEETNYDSLASII